ncbi:DUF1344 domain-containing protein [Devosia sp.]|uniref:DUF1344 domain-containing protein n=1 Tax=Devosia sp. TaxID=1871048 RepID=UPI0032642727
MRKIILPVALAIALGSSGIAFAAAPNTAVNTVKSFDLKAHTLTLENGVNYVLPATFKDPGLKVGAKVTVKWEMKGKAIQADSVTLG